MLNGEIECASCNQIIMDWYLIQTVAIRALNDELRTRLRGGTVIVSDRVKELGDIVVAHAIVAMAESTEFDDDEHQSGHFWFCARQFHWFISYGGSKNPASTTLTKRDLNLTIVL